ncbi:MAG TPA: hypothetical protein VK531_12335 [Gemmatimonadales bacterium]|nr:hypothetical protein [Gemmatimonadales bacterium]
MKDVTPLVTKSRERREAINVADAAAEAALAAKRRLWRDRRAAEQPVEKEK